MDIKNESKVNLTVEDLKEAIKDLPDDMPIIIPVITEKDATAKAIEGEADVELRDTEVVPFTYEGGISAFIENEVHPFAPDAYVDEKKTQIGYEISFTKFFYKPTELRAVKTIISDLESLEMQTNGMLQDILGGLN